MVPRKEYNRLHKMLQRKKEEIICLRDRLYDLEYVTSLCNTCMARYRQSKLNNLQADDRESQNIRDKRKTDAPESESVTAGEFISEEYIYP
jgi:hypothetical protein